MTMSASITNDCWVCVMHRNRYVALYVVIGIAVAAIAAFLPVVVLPYIAVVVTVMLMISVQEHSR